MFDPSRHEMTATGFRWYGPLMRFDHHREGHDREPVDDPERGVYYAATTLSGCPVEVFGDTGVVELGRHHVALPVLERDLCLLDLRVNGAMRAGTKAAVAKVAERDISQAWARHFYETVGVYGHVDGLIYLNAHNDEDAVVLCERAISALKCPPGRVTRLDDEALRPAVLEAADDNNLVVDDV